MPVFLIIMSLLFAFSDTCLLPIITVLLGSFESEDTYAVGIRRAPFRLVSIGRPNSIDWIDSVATLLLSI